MPAAARLGDKAQVDADAHGCPACPHKGVGPIVAASADVFVNDRPAARKDDLGIHAVCCGPNMYTINAGSPTVYVNGKPFARMNDDTKHCGGNGPIIEGSPDVLIDDGATAQGLGSYLIHALAILLQQVTTTTQKARQAGTDTHQPGAAAAQQNLASTPSKGLVTSARWSVQRAKKDDDVQLLIECTANLTGSLDIDIWSMEADGTLDKKVQSIQQNAAQHIKAKWKVAIPPNAAKRNQVDFCFVVKDAQGVETTSDPLFVQRTVFQAQVVDSAGKPIAGCGYELTLPDGTVVQGKTDNDGRIEVDASNQQGQCSLVLVDK
jgi:uncharacterized Zn-binding protein involved in type VI secretion